MPVFERKCGFKSRLAHQLRSFWTDASPAARTATTQRRPQRQLTPRRPGTALDGQRLPITEAGCVNLRIRIGDEISLLALRDIGALVLTIAS